MAEVANNDVSKPLSPPASGGGDSSKKWKWISAGLGAAFLIALICAIVIPLTMDTDSSNDRSAPAENSYDYEILPKEMQKIFDSLTLEQKLGQMNQFTIGDLTGPTAKFSEEYITSGMTGSVFNVDNITQVNYYQGLQKQSPVQIPLIIGYDTIHGYKTIFPVNLGLAATWDTDLVERCFQIAANESINDGTQWAFSPMMDISRDSRWGRMSESFGEDPYLDSLMGVAAVKGLQEGPEGRVASCIKHFAGYGGAESGRDYNLVDMSLQRLHSEYLPGYKAAVKAGAWSVMASFNTMNFLPATANHYLLTDVLKRDWGFSGPIVTDYDAVWELEFHQVAADDYEAGVLAAKAGIDMEMAHGIWYNMSAAAVAAGDIDMSRVDDAVKRILQLKWKVGLFDADGNPKWVWDETNALNTLTDKAMEISVEAGAKAAVLLKNNATLPIPDLASKKVLVLGGLADSVNDTIGAWSARGWAFADANAKIIPFKAAMTESVPAVTFFPGTAGLTRVATDADHLAARTDVINALVDGAFDYVVTVVGESALNMSGEATSRADLDLGFGQTELLTAVRDQIETFTTAKPKMITLVYSGRGLSLEYERNISDALVYAWFPGTHGTHGLMQLLNGTRDFTGRLPISIPRHVGQCPIYYGRPNTGRPLDHDADSPWSEIVRNDAHYKSRYIDERTQPLYPFGFGMSYTTFSYNAISINPTTLPKSSSLDTPVTVTVTVTNTGSRAGTEVVQLYVHPARSLESRPERLLKGFVRVSLEAGASVDVQMTLTLNDFGYYKQAINKDYSIFHTNIEWVIDDGPLSIFAQPNAVPDFDISDVVSGGDPTGMWFMSAGVSANLTITA